MLSQSELMGFIPTADADRAKIFYCDVLQFELEEDNGFALILRTPHGSLRIVRVPEFTPHPFTLLGWEVSAIEAEVQALGAAGVLLERYPYFEQDALGIWTAPGGAKVAWFKDPDGNTLSLSQAKSQRSTPAS